MRWSILVVLLASQVRAADKPDFARDVQPILSENCYACHGPDAKARKAELRLDTQEGALRKKDPVIVPGKSAESEVIKRIVSTDEEEAMPPKHFNKKVSAKQLATLKAWIDSGATWGKHWAFIPPKRGVPGPEFAMLSSSVIDAFILFRLEKEGLKPSPEANRERCRSSFHVETCRCFPRPAGEYPAASRRHPTRAPRLARATGQ